MHNLIDTAFDFQSDTPAGKDPDTHSPTLRVYHKLLWSKPLPNGTVFNLADTTPNVYLHHRSEMGEFSLSSDSVIPTFSRAGRLTNIIETIPAEEVKAFKYLSYTIGGMMIFPSNRVDRKMTINGMRGFHPRINDRFDLTMECIRRHYSNELSPLYVTLGRYANFFRLFGDFRGYVEYFLLQDIVNDDFSAVKFFLPFNNFMTSPLPLTREAYAVYKKLAMEFIKARNSRILSLGVNLSTP